jgi:DNA polymerase-3 subunit beta
MTETYLAIGEVARASGLTVSALRYYDQEDVFVPAIVDATTGYRRYAVAQLRAARLLAGMRRVGVPLADIAVALEQLSDTEVMRGILAGHLQRLEEGLADARREIARVDSLLAPATSEDVRWEVSGPDLAAAFRAVRFGVGTDPEYPALTGVLLELDDGVCRVVATDRYRLAVSSASGRVLDPEDPVSSPADDAVPRAVGQRKVSVTAPVAWVDEVAGRAADGRMLTLHLAPSEIRCTSEEGDDVVAVPLTDDYPDYRRLLDDRDLGTGVDATALAALVRGAHGGGEGPADPGGEGPGGEGLAGEGLGGEGLGGAAAGAGGFRRHTDAEGAPVVLVTASEDRLSVGSTQGAGSVAVGREFLLQALDAAGESPTLRLDGPISPLVIRRDDQTFSLLMPTRIG